MIWRRLFQGGGWLLGAVAVLLVVLYAATQQSTIPEPSVAGAPTPYPSIVLYPTLVPTPGPDTEPHVLDLASGRLEPVPVPSAFAVRAVLSDGTLLTESGQGPAAVVRPDGTSISDLPVPLYVQSELSADHRYVAWIADDHFHVYDAETGQISSEPPEAARFEGSLSDGSTLMRDAAGVWPASPPPATGAQAGEETVIVDRSGAVTDRLHVSRWMVRVSPDERRIAWVAGDGLHVYERSTHAERVYSEVTAVTGEIVWSPDGAEIGYVRFTGDNAVHVWVVDIASGDQHRVYSAKPDAQIQRLVFAANHELQLQIVPLSSRPAQYDLPGPRYVVNDEGSDGHFLEDPTTPWATCGPSCGMPPAGYEDADGLARWCEQTPRGGCILHLVFVDRRTGALRELAASEFVAWSLSPDRRQLAILLPAGTDQVLRIIQLDGFSSRDVPLGFTYANNVGWFPGGQSLLLWTAGPFT
jgi:hypothetical protein